MAYAKTHYQTLNVKPLASRQLIRSAYRSLSQKNHPDRNANAIRAHQRMAEINEAYATLSQPKKRRDYDLYLTSQARKQILRNQNTQQRQPLDTQNQQQTKSNSTPINWIELLLKSSLLFVVLAISLWHSQPQTPLIVEQASSWFPKNILDIQIKPGYTKTATAANGKPWPKYSNYIPGYPKFNTQGSAQLTIDNSQMPNEVVAKLEHIYAREQYPVRVFYVSPLSDFKLQRLTPGSYRFYYQDLVSGYSVHSDKFLITDGINPWVKTIRLALDSNTRPAIHGPE